MFYLLLPNHMLLRSPNQAAIPHLFVIFWKKPPGGPAEVNMLWTWHLLLTLQGSSPMVADCCKMDWTLHPAVVLARQPPLLWDEGAIAWATPHTTQALPLHLTIFALVVLEEKSLSGESIGVLNLPTTSTVLAIPQEEQKAEAKNAKEDMAFVFLRPDNGQDFDRETRAVKSVPAWWKGGKGMGSETGTERLLADSSKVGMRRNPWSIVISTQNCCILEVTNWIRRLKRHGLAPASVVQLVGASFHKPKGVGTPTPGSRDTCLGYRFGSHLECMFLSCVNISHPPFSL